MATGFARGAADRGKRIAFGDGIKIIWDQNSEVVFRGNPNVAPPGQERSPNLQWLAFYKGHRNYNRVSDKQDRWVWNYDFRPKRGEIFLNAAERAGGRKYGEGFVLIEPNVPRWKSVATNKDWGRDRYQQVANRLVADGHQVKQFQYDRAGAPLRGVQQIPTFSFRGALSVMAYAGLYLGPEGGLHHAAAALGVKGVVLFGGFIPPKVTGYDGHANLTGGAEACGSLRPCEHCRAAMDAISVEEVHAAAIARLKKGAA